MKKIFLLFLTLSFSNNAFAQINIGSHDSKLPVEIQADELEVLQHDEKAVFKGNVEAVQGDLNIKADEMLVYYNRSKDQIGQSKNSVSMVETKGNVKFYTPGETAKSDKGIFDVEKNIITLLGNITLTSGKNLVKGEKLIYNLTTGESKIISNKKDNGGRVKGIFTPSEQKK